MTRIAVVDHGAGNLVSIERGLCRAGATVTVVTEPGGFEAADGVVLPGVGSCGAAMDRLDAGGFTAALRSYEGPLLGICVGMQLLFEDSDEEPGRPCLGLIPGRVRRLEDAPLLPHIGWNDVAVDGDPLFAGTGKEPTFYFVHTYAPEPADPGVVIGTTTYGSSFAAAVRSGPLVGVQFHPERSGDAGLAVLANFVAAVAGASRAA